jgi:hypothetical protein
MSQPFLLLFGVVREPLLSLLNHVSVNPLSAHKSDELLFIFVRLA